MGRPPGLPDGKLTWAVGHRGWVGVLARLTAVGYDRLLTTLLVVDPVPAWSTNRLARLTSSPRRHVVEPALLGPLLGVNANGIHRDPDLLGRLLDSFVVAQLRPELTVSEHAPRLYHLRQREGRHEIDLIVELADGKIIAIEIKQLPRYPLDKLIHAAPICSLWTS